MVSKANLSLSDVYKNYSAPDKGGDKGTAHSYLGIYEAEMTKTKNVALLEIGVWEGHSIAMWQEYLTDSYVLGIDVKLDKVKFKINSKLCNATNEKQIRQTLEGMQFDYIIDDGSHAAHDQILSRRLLWDYLKISGKYFIEDIANDRALKQVRESLGNLEHRLYDNRQIKNRSDDILIVIDKVE